MRQANQNGLEKTDTQARLYRGLIFYVILGYYAVTYIFYFYRIHFFLKDVIIAPLFFLMPAGIGLLLLSVFSTHKKILKFANISQLFLSSIFFGFLFISFLYAELNNTDKLTCVSTSIYPIVNLLSLYGFYKTSCQITNCFDAYMMGKVAVSLDGINSFGGELYLSIWDNVETFAKSLHLYLSGCV